MTKEQQQYVNTLQHMMSVLMMRQSAWNLNDNERRLTKDGIEALKAAVEALSVQVYA